MKFINKIKSLLKNNKYLYKKISRSRGSLENIYLRYFSGTNEDIFRKIYLNNAWGDNYSISGTGSNFIQTKKIIDELPIIFKKYKIKKILDLPCGDHFWMSNVNLKEVKYLGADILPELIKTNNIKYGKNNINFKTLDLINSDLPDSDLIFCRDCLVHLSFSDIFKVLKNIKRSNIKFFMSTSFSDRLLNIDIATGSWRTINLLKPPFNFPLPIDIINENCTEGNNSYNDKCLLIWKTKDIP